MGTFARGSQREYDVIMIRATTGGPYHESYHIPCSSESVASASSAANCSAAPAKVEGTEGEAAEEDAAEEDAAAADGATEEDAAAEDAAAADGATAFAVFALAPGWIGWIFGRATEVFFSTLFFSAGVFFSTLPNSVAKDLGEDEEGHDDDDDF